MACCGYSGSFFWQFSSHGSVVPLAIFKQTVSQTKWREKMSLCPNSSWVTQTMQWCETNKIGSANNGLPRSPRFQKADTQIPWPTSVVFCGPQSHSFMHTSFLFCHSSYCCHSKYCRNRVRRLQTKLCKFWAKRIAKHKNNHQSAVICGLMKVAFCVWFDCLVIVVGRRHLQLLDK